MTMKEILEKRQARKKIFDDAAQVRSAAKVENRELTAEDQTKISRMLDDVEKIGKDIEGMERELSLQDSINIPITHRPEGPDGDNRDVEKKLEKRACDAYLRRGLSGMTPEEREVYQKRAMSKGTPADGGYTVRDEYTNTFIDALADFTELRNYCTVIHTETGNDIPIPTGNDTGNSAVIVGENSAMTEAPIPTFDVKTLGSFLYSSKPILVPLQLLEDSGIDIEEYINKIALARIGRKQSSDFTIGAGTTLPFGIITGATLGKTAAATTAMTIAELRDLYFSVDPAYRAKSTFMSHDNVIKSVMALEDDNGRPLWQPSLELGKPDKFLGNPWIPNNSMASSIAASAKTVAFGDLSSYMIRDVGNIVIKRLVERYAEYNQVGFLVFIRSDGLLLDAGTHPVKYMAQAAA